MKKSRLFSAAAPSFLKDQKVATVSLAAISALLAVSQAQAPQPPGATPGAAAQPAPPPTAGSGAGIPSPATLANPNQPSPAAGDPTQAAAGAAFDNRLPALDPAGGLVRFNGQTWSVTDNAVFRARFEKYLNVPEEDGEQERAHREILSKIIGLLDPNVFNSKTISDSYRLLARAAAYPGDSRLCDTIANAIYAVWASKRNQVRMNEANRILEEENDKLRELMANRAKNGANPMSVQNYNATPSANRTNQGAAPKAASQSPGAGNPPSPGQAAVRLGDNPGGSVSGNFPPSAPFPNVPPQGTPGAGNPGAPPPSGANAGSQSSGDGTGSPLPTPPSPPSADEIRSQAAAGANVLRIGAWAQKLVENSVAVRANSMKGALSEAQAKLEYQGLLVQLFLQRRFHHVVIGCRFYRAIFSDGDSKLQLPENNQMMFTKGTGLQATVSSIEALTNELMRETQTGVQAFHRLYDLGEIRSASERLRDALLVGEFLPEVRTVPYERKRRILSFFEKGNRLQAAVETKDYTLAQELISGADGLKTLAKDFDATRVNALIETARNAARLHLAKAKNAAVSGDKAGFEASLQEAGKIWPNNPELQEVAAKAFAATDQMAQALSELDQLIAQKNFRRIADDAGRFLAATQNAPAEKQQQLKTILEDFKGIEAALMASKELDRLGNPAGAWETLDKISQKFPEDIQINQSRAQYTEKAADFVRTVRGARELENRSQLPSSLAWYLKAQRLYPKSTLAEEAVQRLKQAVMSSASAPAPQ